MTKLRLLAALTLALATVPAARAEENVDRAVHHASLIPGGNLVDVSLRDEVGLGIYHKERAGNATWLEPSFPTLLGTGDWLLSHQIHLALLWQPVVVARTGGTYGMGGLRYEALVSPAGPGRVQWGLGPALQFPTETDTTIGDHKWAAGLSGALGGAVGPAFLGISATQLWTYASSGGYPTVNRLRLRPTATVDLRGGFFLLTAPEITADWKRPAADRWTVPVGAGAGKRFSVGATRISLTLEGYWTALGPTSSWTRTWPYTAPPDWSVRTGLSVIFPR